MVSRDIGREIVEKCRLLAVAPFSATPDGLFRPWLSDAFMATQAQIASWMRDAGLSVRHDAAGNLIGRLAGAQEGAASLVFGSHLDSVPNGGAFDGMLGVILGIAVARSLAERGEALPFPVEIMAFGDEEGSAFPVAMITSRAVIGERREADLGLMRDGVSVAQAMQLRGLDPAELAQAERRSGEILAFVEAHIEQGPVLEALDRPIAAVRAIAAQRRGEVVIAGVAGHAGTLPMDLRQDALTAASEAVLLVERIARDWPQGREAGLVATVGRLTAGPGAGNVVPDRVVFSLDVRAAETSVRDAAIAEMEAGFAELAGRRSVQLACTWQQDLAGAQCDPALVRAMQDAALAEGGHAEALVSGAGHDTMIMARNWPSVMLFLRSPGGISHHPDETVLADDVACAHAALLNFVLSLQKQVISR